MFVTFNVSVMNVAIRGIADHARDVQCGKPDWERMTQIMPQTFGTTGQT